MKKTIGVSLFIFFAIVVAILVAGLLFYQNNKTVSNATQNNNINNTVDNKNTLSKTITKISTNTTLNPVLNMTEVAKHNQISNCYMVINNKVYDLSNYASSHPGGEKMIQNYCGKEATQAYNTKGSKGRGHSNYANSLLNTYYLGDLVQ